MDCRTKESQNDVFQNDGDRMVDAPFLETFKVRLGSDLTVGVPVHCR